MTVVCSRVRVFKYRLSSYSREGCPGSARRAIIEECVSIWFLCAFQGEEVNGPRDCFDVV